MSSFINFNNKSDSAINLYSAEVIKEALLISETKSSIKATKIVENIKEPIVLNEALNLFTDKLTAINSLSNAVVIVNEGRVKQFEMDFKDMVNDIKKGYGWIDPEYVAQTWDNSSDSIDFSLVRDEIFDRLINAGLLAHPDSSDPEKAGKKLKSAKELYAFENNETKLEEGKSITKIQKEYGQVVKDMVTTVEEWKAAEGDRKSELLEKLRTLTAHKKDLLAQLDDAVGLKDVHAELAESLVTEAKFKKGQYIKSKNDSDDFDGDVYDRTNDVDGSEILKNSSFEIYEIGKDEVILWSDEDEVEYSIDPDDLKNFVKESVVTEHHSENPNDKYEVRHCDKPETPYGVWEGDTLVKCFELEQDADAFAKEQNKEQGLDEAFSRMSSDTIGNELFTASQALTTYYDWLKAGNDSGKGESIDHVISLLKKCKSNIKRFKTKEETIGTAYEAPLVEGFAECIAEGNAFLAARAKAIEEDAEEFEFNGKKFPVIKESLTEQSDDALILIQQALKGMKNMKAKIKGDTVIISNKAKDEFTYSLNDGGDVQEFIDELEESLVNEKDDAGTHLDNLADLVGNAKSFMNVGKELKAGNYKYDFSTGMMPHYQVEADGFTFMIVNKRYVDKGDREVNNIAIGLLESVSEQSDDVATVTLDSLVEKFEVVTEAKGFKNTTDFEKFLIEIDGMGESQIKKIMGKDYIDTPGFYQDEKGDYDGVEDFMKSNMGTSEFEKLESWWENNVAESVVTEAKFNKKSLMKAMKADDGMIQLGTGEEYVIYAYGNGNDNNDDMWGDKTIFALDQDGEEHEIEYSDIVSYNESVVNEAKEYKAGDTVELKTGETVEINQVVKGPKPELNTYRAKVNGKQIDFSLTDINEGNLTEAKRAGLSKKETLKVAQKFADALTKLDGKKYTVSSDYEEDSFDLDVDGEEYEGGSYNINDDGSVVNMATWNRKTNVSPTYGNMDDDIKTIIKTIKNLKESVVNEDIRGDVKRFIKDNKDSLNDLADQDLWEEMYQKLYDEFGVEADTIKAKDLLKTFQFVF